LADPAKVLQYLRTMGPLIAEGFQLVARKVGALDAKLVALLVGAGDEVAGLAILRDLLRTTSLAADLLHRLPSPGGKRDKTFRVFSGGDVRSAGAAVQSTRSSGRFSLGRHQTCPPLSVSMTSSVA
jgi:hypothetical protein